MKALESSPFRSPFFWVLALFILLFTHHEPGSVNDESRMAFVERMITTGKPWTERSPYFNTLDMVFWKGHFYSDKPVILSLYSTAVVFPVTFFVGFGTEWGKAILYYIVTVTSCGFSLMAIFYYLHRIFGLLKLDARVFKWTAVSVLFGSSLLTFSTVYNNHAVEAALIFASFYYLLDYRVRRNSKAPFLIGLFLGLAFSIHGYAGVVFLVLSGFYFLLRRFQDCLKFALTGVLVLALGVAANKMINDEFKPFYYMPISYIYKGSYWLTYPVIPHLDGKIIHDRFAELGMSKQSMREFVLRHVEYEEQMANPLHFAKNQFLRHDYLTLNAIFMFGLLSALLCLRHADFQWKLETLWVVLGALGIYLLVIHMRSGGGQTFGNRYLIPAMPLIAFFTAFGMKTAPNPGFFKIAMWPTIALHLASIARPWHVPPPILANVGYILFWVTLILFLVTMFVKRLDLLFEMIAEMLAKRIWLAAFLFAVLVGAALTTYTAA